MSHYDNLQALCTYLDQALVNECKAPEPRPEYMTEIVDARRAAAAACATYTRVVLGERKP